MQSAVNGHYCPSCNHLMIALNLAGVFGECSLCPKPVTMANCQLHQQQCPINSYPMGKDKATEQEGVSISEMESDQWSLYSEGISGSVYNHDSYNSLDDQQTLDTCRQCCSTFGHNELVVPKLHNLSLSYRSSHFVVCRYCGEKESMQWRKDQFKDRPKHPHQDCRLDKTRQLIDCDFAVNCIPVEETINRSDNSM